MWPRVPTTGTSTGTRAPYSTRARGWGPHSAAGSGGLPPQAVALTKNMDAFLLEDLCPRQSPLLPKITFTSAQQWPTKFAIERCQILPCCRSLFLLVDTRISFRGRWMAAATCASIGAERDFRWASRRLKAVQRGVSPTRVPWHGHTAAEWRPPLPHAQPTLVSRPSAADPRAQAPPAHPPPATRVRTPPACPGPCRRSRGELPRAPPATDGGRHSPRRHGAARRHRRHRRRRHRRPHLGTSPPPPPAPGP